MAFFKFSFLVSFLFLIQICVGQSINSYQFGLKDYYHTYFPIGVAVSPISLEDVAESELILREFGSLTAENVMKPALIHPSEGVYNWAPADKITAFAKANQLKIRGHTLCWHSQTPKWFFEESEGRPASRELALSRLKDHIQNVMGRYKGEIYAWDVVNEAISDDAGLFLRESDWYKIIGPDYIEKAFEYAHEADPDALLFYNDYNVVDKAKGDKIFKLIESLKAKGVPIHGIGLQAHWSIFHPNVSDLERTIVKFSKLGITIQITELDISVYDGEQSDANLIKAPIQFTKEQEKKQIHQYKMIFEVFRKNKDSITGVTFWNISDRHSWLDNYPIRDRKNFPLLFDQNLKRKKAYWEIANW